jgi:hypothetical protein
MMIAFIRRKHLTVGYIEKSFAEKVMTKYTLGARDFLFRIMVVTMYWENRFQPMPLLLLATHARDMDAKVTNCYSYRATILTACVKVLDVTVYHALNRELLDYPPIKVVKDYEARCHWERESLAEHFGCISPAISAAPIIKRPSTAESIIDKHKLAEQAYAFGYQITEACTVASS